MGDGLKAQLDWVASYPKSGNTWLRLLLGSYLNDQVVGYDDVGSFFFQCASPYPVGELNLWQEVQLRGAALMHIAAAADNNQTLIKTHHAMCEVGGIPLFAEAFVRKAAYVIRDPRDVAVSLSHHVGLSQEETVELMGSLEARLKDEKKAHHVLSSWSYHVASWAYSEKVPAIITQYEKLQEDTAGELKRIVSFMGWTVNNDRIDRAVELNQFDKLQQEEKAHGFSERSPKSGLFFRRGKVGAWRDELDPVLAQRIEREHGDVMKEWGYEPEMKPALTH